MAKTVHALLVFALLLAGFALKGVLIAPPASGNGEFNTPRAMNRLQRILGDERPHPVDSDANDAVRSRMIAELQAIGLKPRIQDTMDCSAMPKTRFVSCSYVRNVIATIPGQKPGPQPLLNAHYDSTPTGPGAGDDGLGVAVLLEVGSILQAAPPPRPVTLLFNEGEEFGLNGAHAFVRADPQARQVNSLINIDTRGVNGPALMYETSEPNGAALSIYSAATSRPYANSISTDFARLIPNTTDVVFFRPAGWTLLNYAIVGNETRYHSPGDTVAALNPDSVGQVGSEVLAATRSMALAAEPARAGSRSTVFTDFAGRFFLHLPLAVAAVLLGLLLFAGFVLAWRDASLRKPLVVASGMVAGGSLIAGLVSIAASLVRPGDFWRAYPLATYLAVYATLLLAMGFIWWTWGRALDRRRMRAAAWLLILIFGSALSLALPGATIFFLIAPAIALAGIASSNRSPFAANFIVTVAIVVQFVMFAELLALIEMLLIDGPLAAVVLLAALAALPAIVEVDAKAWRLAVVSALFATIGLWIGAITIPRASAERPLQFSIDYFRDATKQKANWAVATKQAPLPSGYPGQWDKAVLSYNGRTRWVSSAPLLETPVASARVMSSEKAGNGRKVRISLSPGGANTISIRFPKEANIVALGLAGAVISLASKGEPDKPLLRCTGRTCEGLQIDAVFGNTRPVEAELFATRFGLPPQGQPLVTARPRNAIPQYAPDQTITLSHFKF
jgi:Peptidase family M28